MQLCGKKIPVPRFIILRLRKLFRGSRQVSVRETLASDESWTAVDVDGDLMPQTAESSVDEDSEPLLAASVYRDEHLLPLDCAKLGSADVEIFTTLPNRAGAFTNVWNGSLAGDRVVIKSYRLYSAEDFTHARMVRFRMHLRTLCYTDPPFATEVLQGSTGVLKAFPSKHRPVPGCVHHLRTPVSSRVRLRGTLES